MIPIPLFNLLTFFNSTVSDNVNTLKINVKISSFLEIFPEVTLCTLTILTLTTYTCNHMANVIKCKACQEICCHVVENVFKIYVNVTSTM